ncbi:sensor histidine kinase [Acetivibrio cellulolyticus]|uniref:sensor histidine kinase n=1 Tax=Acetivibrio cellulolyticus TaxID=35830 RepID=UPI0001E2D46A|nr:sensor histidine kinase [Acetivibrio cellulolyticus]
MKKGIGLLYIIFRDISMLVTFVLALYLERAVGSRFYLMLLIFTLLFSWLHVREVFKGKFEKFLPYSFVLDVLMLVMLDESSKYLVNHYFNVYYFYVLIAAGFMLKEKSMLFVSLGVILAAFIKYSRFFEAVFCGNKPANMTFIVSYIFFTFMVFITVGVFFNYSRMLSEQKEKLDELNRELTGANSLLEEKNRKIKELTIFEERNRIAHEIHDSVGHNLTGLIMNLDFCKKIVETNPSGVAEYLGKSRQIAKECLEDIRKSVRALKNAEVEQLTLIKSIEELVESSVDKFNIEVLLDIKGEKFNTQPEFNLAVYRACQEAITNSIRHGMADKVEISIIYGKREFSMFIKDNGTGAKELNYGTGLTGMMERFGLYNGVVSFYKNGGFMINISVPMEGIINE